MKPEPRILIMISTLALILGAAAQHAQVPGFAEISRPTDGESISGVVTIEGTASHPDFRSYSISFAYDPNPTDTWFVIADGIQAPVSDSRLAVWDTSGLTPGTYQLRLTVVTQDGKSLESVVGGLQIGPQNPSSTTAAIVPTATASPPPAAGLSEQPPEAEPTQTASPSPGDTLIQVLKIGALSAMAALMLLGLYTGLRPKLRTYLGSVQNRRLDPRRRTRRRGQR